MVTFLAVAVGVAFIGYAVYKIWIPDEPKYVGDLPSSKDASLSSGTESTSKTNSIVTMSKYSFDEENAQWKAGPNILPGIERGETVEHFSKRRREMAIAWANKVLAKKENYVILDTETTGLGENDVIVQLAVIDMDGNPIINTLIKPSKRKRISAESTAIHGIKMADLKDAPTLLDVVDQLEAAVKGKIAIIYNAQFDYDMLFQTMVQDEFRKLLKFRMHCAMKQYAAFVGQYSEYHGDFKFQKLPGGDHTAVGDCRATLEVIRMMAMADELV